MKKTKKSVRRNKKIKRKIENQRNLHGVDIAAGQLQVPPQQRMLEMETANLPNSVLTFQPKKKANNNSKNRIVSITNSFPPRFVCNFDDDGYQNYRSKFYDLINIISIGAAIVRKFLYI